MKVQAGVNIHNRFDIEVRNVETGELKQRAVAHNIVLDKMWTTLCAFQTYHNYIHFGTGTGTPSAARTTLFAWLGTKISVNDELIKAIPISSWKKKIVIDPEEFVGSIITEVGIGTSATASTIVTHALIQDAEGNPISINKTALDLVTIFATVYVTFSTQDASKIKFVGMPDNNTLVNWLIGGATFLTQSFYLGENDGIINETDRVIESKPILGSSATVSISNWIKDAVNKKVTTPSTRFSTIVGNGNAMEIGFGSYPTNHLFRSVLPISGAHNGQSYIDVPLGAGDGVTKEFILPSRNVKQTGIIMKKNGVSTVNFTKSLVNNAINFAFNDSALPPTGAGNGCAISSNGLVAAIANNGASVFSTYDLVGCVWIKRPAPVASSGGNGISCALSNDGSILAIGRDSTPFISTYEWTGGAWQQRPDPVSLPKDKALRCSLSGDGLILAVAHDLSPFISTYDWTGGAWIKRPNPVSLPSKTGRSCTLSNDGSILIVGLSDIAGFIAYDWTGGAWIKRPNPVSPPDGGYCYSCSLSGDGLILAVAHHYTPFISTYDWTGGAWIKRPNPVSLPTSTAYGCSLSNDGSILAVATSGNYPRVFAYDWTDGAWIKKDDPVSLPTGGAYGCGLSGDGSILAVCFITVSPYLLIYDLKKRQTKISFDTAPAVGEAITADYTVEGIHKTDQYVVDVSFSLQFGEVTP